jgi:chromosome segregation ATPase
MKAAAKDISDAKSKLKKLTNARHKDAKAIAAQKKALAQARSEYKKASAGLKMVNTWGDETKKLQSYSNQISALGKKIDDAKKKLADATKARDDFAASTRDQFDNLPDVSEDTKLPDYIAGLQKQIADTQIFTSQLAELKKLGLNDEMYKQLLAKGTNAIPFVTQILEGGKTAVDEINTLDSALAKSATSLGDVASKAL